MFASLALATLLALPAQAGVAPRAAARPLWNGSDLAGWHGLRHQDPYALAAMPEAERAALLAEDEASMRAHWRVENGALVNDGEGAYLTSDAEFGDAEYELEYRTVPLADSGIYLRACPQVQIWDTTQAGGKWDLGADKGSGGLWNNEVHARFPEVLADRPFGEWNRLVIRQLGERVWVELNGQATVNGVVLENYWNRALPVPARGPLQLQTHGGEIRFRNLSVRELTPAEVDALLAAEEAEAFEPLFDGTSFAGWQGDLEGYTIEDGILRCRAGAGGNLYTTERFDDCVVRLRFRLPPGGNNGLALRYPGEGTPAYSGLEVQILDDSDARYATIEAWQAHGSVYGVVPAVRGYLRPVGEWNFEEVEARGSRIVVRLNGTTIVDADIAGRPSALEGHVGKDRREGFLGFCGHGDPVEFRDIRVRRLGSR